VVASPRIVALGGGRGLPAVVEGLADFSARMGERDPDAIIGVTGDYDYPTLAQASWDFSRALDRVLVDGVIGPRGRVLPMTAAPIHRLSLEPSPRPLPHVLRALVNADAIVVGPGSLYTSLLPNLRVQGVAATIYGVDAVRIYVANLMTVPGETDRYTLDDHLRVIRSRTGFDLFDYILVHRGSIDEEAARRYAALGSERVVSDPVLRHAGRARVIDADLAANVRGGAIRHDPASVAREIRSLAKSGKARAAVAIAI
jgi:2-phospho-L-lactate transferase/gluconeogenesis factor (CofD/UPF0052 family)